MNINERLSIKDSDKVKVVSSDNYNFIFDKTNGLFCRWGKDFKDDPLYSPSNEILDIEVTTSCKYCCPWCYKSNNPVGKNMSFDTFKLIFDKINKSKILTQIAFGVDAHCKSNPDIWKMMEYSRENGVIPNLTIAEADDEVATNIAKYCGVVCVSEYNDHNICYDTCRRLMDKGMTVNIHKMLCRENFIETVNLIDNIVRDDRLKGLNAVTFLSLKQKGRGKYFNRLEDYKFIRIIKQCLENKINFGFDSCTASKFIKTAKLLNIYDNVKNYIEPCESTLFSAYINVDGIFYPCSFCEGVNEWKEGISVIDCDDFIKDVWNNERTIQFRNNLIGLVDCNNCRCCPYWNI